MEGIYLIAGLKIKLNYHFEAYLKNNIEKYQCDALDYDHEIKVSLSEDIHVPPYPTKTHKNPFVCFYDNQRFIYAKHASGDIQSMMIHDVDYMKTEIIINPNRVKDAKETEYVLLSVVFLEIAIRHHLLPIHASAILYRDEVILFSAPSQTGKSTHARYWKQVYPSVEFINDDKPLIRKEGSEFMVYGTPFSGKTSVNQNIKKPLKAIIFLEQGLKDQVITMKVKEKIEALMKNILRPEDNMLWDQVTKHLTDLIQEMPMYKLQATHNTSAVHAIHRTLYPEEEK